MQQNLFYPGVIEIKYLMIEESIIAVFQLKIGRATSIAVLCGRQFLDGLPRMSSQQEAKLIFETTVYNTIITTRTI